MGKIAFIFPGQGAQYPGMGKDFYENSNKAKEVYELASKVSGLDVASLCFEENDQLNITEYTQIAMLTTEIAMLRVLEEKGIMPDVAAGLSLGEYAALAVTGAVSLSDLFNIIRKRGIFMQEAYPEGGAMTAVLGIATDEIEKVCQVVQGEVSIANYNCPGQIVITGEENSVKEASEKLMESGAKRCIPLKVSGPFHSPLLKKASAELAVVLNEVSFLEYEIPYLSNVTANYVEDKNAIKNLLEKQIASPVRWQQSIERMIRDNVTTFIEIGPGKTLSGFMRKIDRSVCVMNIEKYEDINKILESIKGK